MADSPPSAPSASPDGERAAHPHDLTPAPDGAAEPAAPGDRLRRLGARVCNAVHAAHSASVPF